jgi:hypothetical protein
MLGIGRSHAFLLASSLHRRWGGKALKPIAAGHPRLLRNQHGEVAVAARGQRGARNQPLHDGTSVAVIMREPISSPTSPHRPTNASCHPNARPLAGDLVEPDVLRKIGEALAQSAKSAVRRRDRPSPPALQLGLRASLSGKTTRVWPGGGCHNTMRSSAAFYGLRLGYASA